MNVLITKFRKAQTFADIVDATQLSIHPKIPEKIMQAKEQNKDLEGATYNDVNDELVRYSLNAIFCHVRVALLSCSVFKNLKSIFR